MILLSFGVISCSSNKRMEKSKDSKFSWMPTVAAPYNYPIEIKYAFVGFGTEGDEYPVMDRMVHKGLGVPGGAVSLNEFEEDEKQEVPNSINVLWLSYSEAKYYEAKIKLPKALQDRMTELFKKELYLRPQKKRVKYENFVITLLPGGQIWLYLAAKGRRDLICDTIQAHEVKMSLKQFDKEAAHFAKNTKEYCTNSMDSNVIANLQTNGIPMKLWDTYRERFNYDIRLELEDPKARLGTTRTIYNYANGEFVYEYDGNPIDMKARLSELLFEWNVGETKYEGWFYFDEHEVIEIFRKAFGENHNQRGEFIVRVSKYNNRFEIFLRVGVKEYPLKKTKIYAFLTTPRGGEEEDELYYSNNWDINPDDIRFIGG